MQEKRIDNIHCSAQPFQILLKTLSKSDPFLMADNISVNFEICNVAHADERIISNSEKKNFTSQLGLMLVAVH